MDYLEFRELRHSDDTLAHSGGFKYVKREWKNGRWNYTYDTSDGRIGWHSKTPSTAFRFAALRAGHKLSTAVDEKSTAMTNAPSVISNNKANKEAAKKAHARNIKENERAGTDGRAVGNALDIYRSDFRNKSGLNPNVSSPSNLRNASTTGTTNTGRPHSREKTVQNGSVSVTKEKKISEQGSIRGPAFNVGSDFYVHHLANNTKKEAANKATEKAVAKKSSEKTLKKDYSDRVKKSITTHASTKISEATHPIKTWVDKKFSKKKKG